MRRWKLGSSQREERPGLTPLPLQPLDRRLHRPRDPRILLDVRLQPRPVAEHLLPPRDPQIPFGIILRRQPQPRLVVDPDAPGARVGRRDVGVISRPPDPDDLVEPPPEPVPGLAEQGVVRDQGRADAPAPEQVGEDRLVGAERRPALLRVGEPIAARPPAPPGGQGRQVLGEVKVEDDPLGREPVERGRLDPGISIRAEEPEVQAVAGDDEDVHAAYCSDRNRTAGGMVNRHRPRSSGPARPTAFMTAGRRGQISPRIALEPVSRTLRGSHPLLRSRRIAASFPWSRSRSHSDVVFLESISSGAEGILRSEEPRPGPRQEPAPLAVGTAFPMDVGRRQAGKQAAGRRGRGRGRRGRRAR